MAKAVRYKVRCTICHEVFQNDYVGKHTKSKHKDLHASGRQAPTTIELDTCDTRQSKMDSFFCTTPANDSNSNAAKRRKMASSVEVTKPSEPEDSDGSPPEQEGSSAQRGKLP